MQLVPIYIDIIGTSALALLPIWVQGFKNNAYLYSCIISLITTILFFY